MGRTIDMQFMRYLNLFNKITKVRTKHCFSYNNNLIFVVNPKLVSKAIGEGGRNVKKLSRIIKKKIKIIPKPKNENKKEMEKLISKIVSPLEFSNLEIKNQIELKANRHNKAALIGRGRKREEELGRITKEFFNKEVRIV
jgi:NusA-like KH domain protein